MSNFLATGNFECVQALDAGLVPVLHGDAVMDTARGCTILGGDEILLRFVA